MNLSYKRAISFGFLTFIENIRYFIGILMVALAAVLLPSGLAVAGAAVVNLFNQRLLYYSAVTGGAVLGLFIALFLSVFFAWASLKAFKIGSKSYDHISITWEDCLSLDAKKLFRFIVSLSFYLGLVALGLIALIAPGVYLAVRYAFVPNFIADNQTIKKSFKESSKLTDGFKWSLLWKIILIILTFSVPPLIFKFLTSLFFVNSLNPTYMPLSHVMAILVFSALNYIINFSANMMMILASTYLYKELKAYKNAPKKEETVPNSDNTMNSTLTIDDLEDIDG